MEQTIEQLIQNLKDAGCTEEEIQCIAAKLEKGATAESMRLLHGCRKRLLEGLHAEQKKLDCLDYLVHQLKNK